jgi:hypothetical protein
MALLLCAAIDGTAQINLTFEGGELPPDTMTYGDAWIADDGTGANSCLHLTDPITASHGQFLIQNVGNGKNVRAIDIRWRSLIGGGSSGGADGYSLNWATDLPETPEYAFPGEDGVGSGLTVTVDTWDNGFEEAPGIELRWKSNLVAFAPIPKDDPGGGLPYLRRNQFVDAQLTVDAKGLATFTYDGIEITAVLNGWKGLTRANMLLGARTGGASDRHWIDDFRVTTGIFTTGVFNGLFHENDAVRHDRSGFVSIKLTPKGTFSGYLILGGARHPLTGKFDLETLKANVRVARPQATALNVELELKNQDSIAGTVNDGNWVADLQADRQVWHKRFRPATPYAGQYSFIVDRGAGALPGGYGFGTVGVDAAGAVKFAGALGDGAKATQKVTVSRNGLWPFYLSLYKGQGSMLGWIQLDNESARFGGTTWTKKSGVPGPLYPAGFSFQPQILVDPYIPPELGAKILNFSSGRASFEGGNLGTGFASLFVVSPQNQIGNSDATRLTLRFVGKAGLVSGTVLVPGTNTKLKYSGVILQSENLAAGHFIGPTESGSVIVGEK